MSKAVRAGLPGGLFAAVAAAGLTPLADLPVNPAFATAFFSPGAALSEHFKRLLPPANPPSAAPSDMQCAPLFELLLSATRTLSRSLSDLLINQ